MAAQLGRNYALKMNTSGSTYALVAGGQELTLTVSNEAVDVTTADDAGVRKLLEGAGVNSVSVKAQGVYVDDAVVPVLRTAAMTNAHKMMQVVCPGTTPKTYQGSFMIASFEEAGKYNVKMTYNITLESAGTISLA